MSGSQSTTTQNENSYENLSALLEKYGTQISKERRENFNILLVGRTGVGKSSIINSLLGKQVSPVGDYEPTTMSITSFEVEAFNNKFTIVDTPGLCNDLEEKNNDKMYIELIRAGVAEIDCLLFVTPFYETRITMDEKRAIKLISDGWGKEIWNQAIIVFTFANSRRTDNYHEAYVARTRLIRQEIARWTVPSIAENIPSVATDSKAITTPDGQLWQEQLYLTLFNRSLDRRSRLREKVYRVLVVGEVNQGKSSFVNALIGQKILPTGIDPATSIFRVRRADTEAYRVRFEDGTTHSIRKEDLYSYAYDEWSKTNSISSIEVDITSDSLPKGIEILDTPGLGSLYAGHAAITQSLVPVADAVIFTLGSMSPMTLLEKDFIRMLLDVMEKPNILFIQTQIDLLSQENWQLVLQRNEQILLAEFGNRLPDTRVWPISSNLLLESVLEDNDAYFEESRYKEFDQAFRSFLEHVLGHRPHYEKIPLISLYNEEKAKYGDEDLQLALFAIARTSLDSDVAAVDNTYIVQAGLSQSKLENDQHASLNLAMHNIDEQISFDILLRANESVKLTTEWHQVLNYNPRLLELQFVEFSFQPRAPGHCVLDINFYHEQRWLTSTQIEFEAAEKLQLIVPSSGRDSSPVQVQHTRLTYGLETAVPFDPSIDPESKKFLDKHLGTWLCMHRFDILVAAGDAIDPGVVVTRIFRPMHANQHEMMLSLYATSEREVRYIDEEHVKKIGTITLSRKDISRGLNWDVEVKILFDISNTEIEVLGIKTGDIAPIWIEAKIVDDRSVSRIPFSQFEITS